ncbi:2-C-methyl-D-erythritol 2,4-cyclodiphosphate synthase [Candidatus Auribacterota bacterium]
MRVGIGYDVHKFEKGRKLVLGGVEIPHDTGLAGHSDADVLIHAIVDALLGALGKKDIGHHFPDTDNKYKDISSRYFLEEVRKLLEEENYAVSNIDTVIAAAEPKISPHTEQIGETVANDLHVKKEQVNIKATTTEGLGFVGEKKGIAAYAIVCLIKKTD